VKQAQEKNIHIVTYTWLEKSLDNGVLEPEAEYAIEVEETLSGATGVKRPAEEEEDGDVEMKDAEPVPEPASKKAKATNGSARPKRGAAKAVKEDEKDEEEEKTTDSGARPKREAAKAAKEEEKQEEEKPAGRPKRGAAKKAAPVKDEDEEEEKPKAKVTRGKSKAKATKDEEEEPEAKKDDEETEEKPKAKSTKKGKAKAEEEPEKEEVKMKTVVKKGRAPVDEYSGLQCKYGDIPCPSQLLTRHSFSPCLRRRLRCCLGCHAEPDQHRRKQQQVLLHPAPRARQRLSQRLCHLLPLGPRG
jgi:hypothetical protein